MAGSGAARAAPLLAFLLGFAADGAAQEDGFAPLFDGRTLAGWSNPFDWGEARVVDGVVELRSEKKFFLVSDRTFADFVLVAEVNVAFGANSGIQFRSHVEKNRVFGLQAEIDPSERRWAGGLYDEGRRGWLEPLTGRPERQAAFRPGEWNRYRIECLGAHVRIWVNDVLTADSYDAVDLDGHVALQHHGEKDHVVRFRDVRVRELGRHEWRPLFDGETLAGWRAGPGGTWRVAGGRIVGESPASEPRHGLLVSEGTFDDFVARVRFRVERGNSGFYFRSEEVDDAVGVHGFQAEIDPRSDVGGLYETGGRGWVARPPAEELAKHLAADGFQELLVAAQGRRVLVRVNGWKSAELEDDPGRASGRFALQLHGGMEMHVEFEQVDLLVPAIGTEASRDGKGSPAPLAPGEFEALHAALVPTSLETWETIPWELDLLAARARSAATGRPMFLWR